MAMPLLAPLLQRLLAWFGGKLILALGLSFVTYKGFQLALNALRSYVINHFSSLPADIYQLLMMAGFGQAIGIIFGAFAFKAAMSVMGKLVARKG